MREKDVYVVIAARNEAESIGQVLAGIKALEVGARIHTLVVDDGSEDHTADAAWELADEVMRQPGRGPGFSIRTGFGTALERGSRFIINMDADGQHDPKLLQAMLQKLENGSVAVKCSRFHPRSAVIGSPPKDRCDMNRHFAQRVSSSTGHAVTDALCGFWGFKRQTLASLLPHLESEDYGLWIETLIKLPHVCAYAVPVPELPHPAIYSRNSAKHRRVYSDAAQAERAQRFRDHEVHIARALAWIEQHGKGEP